MAVIRSHNAQSLLNNAVVLDLGDLARQAELLKAEARREAQKIIADAKQRGAEEAREQTEQAIRDGHEQGLKQGIEEGQAQGRAEAIQAMTDALSALNENWAQALTQFVSDRHRMLADLQRDLVLLATQLTQQVVNRHVELNVDAVADQLKATIALVAHRSAMRICVHPDDVALVEELLPDLIKQTGSSTDASIAPDESIGRGGCRIDTNGVSVDATIPTQIRRIAQALLPGDQFKGADDAFAGEPGEGTDETS